MVWLEKTKVKGDSIIILKITKKGCDREKRAQSYQRRIGQV